MKKNYIALILCTFVFAHSVSITTAQSWFREGFDGTPVPADTTPLGWSQLSVAGTAGFPNGFKRQINSAYPTISGGYSGSAAFIKFNNRNATYPAPGNWCVAGDAAILTTPPLDWSGRKSTSQGYISMRFYRSNSIVGGVHFAADSISVYLNNQPNLTGAVELTEGTLGTTYVPRSSVMAPVGTANAWNLLEYNLPAYGTYTWLDTSSTVYLLIKATSQGSTWGGDNMYLDSINVAAFPLINAIENSNNDNIGTINLFPNPTSDVVNVQFNNTPEAKVEISVCDFSGRKINVDLTKTNPTIFQLKTSQLANGIYTLTIMTNNFFENKKFIVSKN